MRFVQLHRIASYLLAFAGFSALALSGELPTTTMLLTLVAGVASLFFEPGRRPFLQSREWLAAWNVLSVVLAGWTVFSIFRGNSLLLEGVQFLCFLLVNKLWNRRSSRDYLQLYVLSFLMLVAGTTLNTSLGFAPAFVAYVICATWALTLLHLRREIEDNFLLRHGGAGSERVEVERVLDSRRVVGGAFLAVTSLMSAGIFLVSGLFFFAFPRIGWNAFFRHQRHGLTVGFNDHGVRLGDNGLIKDNEQVIMRVEFPGGRPQQPLYFRGISFERYRDGRWTPASGLVRHPLRRSAGFTLVGVPQTRKRYDGARLVHQLAGTLQQEIYLEPMEASVLFAASTPVALGLNHNQSLGAPNVAVEGAWIEHDAGDGGDGEARTSHPTNDIYAYRFPGGIRYTAWSHVRPADEKLLGNAAAPSDAQRAELAEYLDAGSIPPRVVQLAARITEGMSRPDAKVQAVLRFLRRDYRYSLQLVHDPRKEPVEEFLFDRKEGHCEYFASAMALLLRAAGVPTRHVAGFYGGEWNQVGRYLQVRQRDAHAWVEAWLGEDMGWVTFDPTPVAGGVELRSGITDRVRQMMDVMELAWFKYVIEYDLGTQMDLLGRVQRWLRGPSRSSGRESSGRSPLAAPVLRRPLSVLGALFAVSLAVWFVRQRRQRPQGPAARRAHGATRAIERAMRALERRGCQRGPGDTPRDVLRRAEEHGDPGAHAFSELVPLYYDARFGGERVDPTRLSSLASEVVRARPQAPARTPRLLRQR